MLDSAQEPDPAPAEINDVERFITDAFRRTSSESAHTLTHQQLRRRAVMRKVLISLAAAGTALAFATPAAAQYYPQPQPQPYGYGAPQYGYGYNNNYGQVRALQYRIDAVQRQINRLDRRDRIRDRSA